MNERDEGPRAREKEKEREEEKETPNKKST